MGAVKVFEFVDESVTILLRSCTHRESVLLVLYNLDEAVGNNVHTKVPICCRKGYWFAH